MIIHFCAKINGKLKKSTLSDAEMGTHLVLDSNTGLRQGKMLSFKNTH